MNDAATIARAYIDTWNALDGEQLGSLLAQHWARDAHYGDPLMEGDGHAAISGLVQAVQQRFPEYRFVLKAGPTAMARQCACHGRWAKTARSPRSKEATCFCFVKARSNG
jgi:hypothetical protein